MAAVFISVASGTDSIETGSDGSSSSAALSSSKPSASASSSGDSPTALRSSSSSTRYLAMSSCSVGGTHVSSVAADDAERPRLTWATGSDRVANPQTDAVALPAAAVELAEPATVDDTCSLAFASRTSSCETAAVSD